MEPLELPASFFHHSFWLLVGVAAIGGEDPPGHLSHLHQTGFYGFRTD